MVLKATAFKKYQYASSRILGTFDVIWLLYVQLKQPPPLLNAQLSVLFVLRKAKQEGGHRAAKHKPSL